MLDLFFYFLSWDIILFFLSEFLFLIPPRCATDNGVCIHVIYSTPRTATADGGHIRCLIQLRLMWTLYPLGNYICMIPFFIPLVPTCLVTIFCWFADTPLVSHWIDSLVSLNFTSKVKKTKTKEEKTMFNFTDFTP